MDLDEVRVRAVDEENLARYLEVLGIGDDFAAGRLNCCQCGTRLRPNNLGGVLPGDLRVLSACDRFECLRRLALAEHLTAPKARGWSFAWSALIGFSESVEASILLGLGALAAGAAWAIRNHDDLVSMVDQMRRATTAIEQRKEDVQQAQDAIDRLVAARDRYLQSGPQDVISGAMKIVWVADDECHAERDNGAVVVYCPRSPYRGRNLANIAAAYSTKAVIPRARRIVDPAVMEAIDWKITYTLAREAGLSAATDALEHDMPASVSSTHLGQIERIDVEGWLTREVLAEFLRVGAPRQDAKPPQELVDETRHFLEWVHRVAVKPRGRRGHLVHDGRFFKAEQILVGTQSVAQCRETVTERLLTGAVDVVFVSAKDAHIRRARDVVVDAQRLGAEVVGEPYEYELRPDYFAQVGVGCRQGFFATLIRRRPEGSSVQRMPFARLRRRGDACYQPSWSSAG